MKKVRNTIALTVLAIAAGSLASCGKKTNELVFWSSFGSAYTNALDDIVAEAANRVGTPIKHESQGSYDKCLSNMKSAIQMGKYPNMVTGYPDHFVEYMGPGILVSLDKYIERYDKEFGPNKYGKKLLEDYNANYMKENMELTVDAQGNPVVSGLPFNKSTELMGYNGTFVDYCASLAEYKELHLDEVPETWQEWAEVGGKGEAYRTILDSLVGTGNQDGKCVYGLQDVDGSTHDFEVTTERKGATYNGKKLLLDFVDVAKKSSRVISWDSTDNMFITLIRQWGSEYTKLPDSEKTKNPNDRRGDIMFYSEENLPKTIECLQFFKDMNNRKIFGVPQEFNQSYNSDAFEANQVMFMLCSSGGLSYNTAKWENRFRVSPLPYFDDGKDVRKFVISQGADITMTKKVYFEDKSTEEKDKSLYDTFKSLVALTTGDLQAEWCLQTGYYPCSESATKDPKYQEFLKEDTEEGIQEYMRKEGCTYEQALQHVYEKPTRVAYREGSQVNEEHYMKAEEEWNKFVDPAFIGSAKIRELSKKIFNDVFQTEGISTFEQFKKILEDDVVRHPDITSRATNIRVVE